MRNSYIFLILFSIFFISSFTGDVKLSVLNVLGLSYAPDGEWNYSRTLECTQKKITNIIQELWTKQLAVMQIFVAVIIVRY